MTQFYFPVGLALSPQASWLYVANSDFDLQFNAGSLQVYDLDALRNAVPKYCNTDAQCSDGKVCDLPGASTNRGAATHYCVDPEHPDPCDGRGRQDAAERAIQPGLCRFIDPAKFRKDSVGIGAFATDVIYRANPDGPGARLFVPVRGDATLHWIDVDDDTPGEGTDVTLDCGQDANGRCDADHRRGEEPVEENSRNLQLPTEPFGVAADARGEAIVTTHQTEGKVALFVNRWSGGASGGPQLQYVLSDLPAGALGITAVPEPAAVVDVPAGTYRPSFLMTFRNSAEVRLVRYFNDQVGGTPGQPTGERPFLDSPRTSQIGTNSQGFDSRGIAVDSSARAACEATCVGLADDAAKQCRIACVDVPLEVFVANRTPPSMIFGRTQAMFTAPEEARPAFDDLPRFWKQIPVTTGASRVVVGDVLDVDGQPARRVFLVSFDTRQIFIVDPVAQRIEAQVATGRGPYALAIDSKNGYGYVAHFTDSYLGVIDLDQSHTETYGKLILSVGEPIAPRASK